MNWFMEYFYGVLDLSFWGYVIATLVSVQITIMAVTLYLHRDQTHRGVDLHPVIQHFFRFWLWLTTGMVTKEWVAVHRKHHALCETEDDPHSPQVLGLSKVLFEGAELYRDAAADPEMLEKYGRGTPNDWIERNLYTRHSVMGVGLMIALDLVLFGVPGIIILSLQLMSIPLFAAGVINGIGHYWGYRNFECDDAATNIVPWAFLLGGEELHNNHHAFPSSAKFSVQRWEFDIGWLYIRCFETLKLARVKKVAPKPVVGPAQQIDFETLRAVIVNRMHVLREYGRRVTLPVLRDEARSMHAARRALRKAKYALIRHHSLLDERARENLNELLAGSAALKTVHEFGERLQNIWRGANVSNERLVAQLREWCVQAEQSGIEALRDFALRLRGYGLQPA